MGKIYFETCKMSRFTYCISFLRKPLEDMLQQNEGVSQKQRETWMTPASQAGLEWAGEEIPGENSWFRRTLRD